MFFSVGHERYDVVKDREQFVQYFLQHQDNFYTISEGDNPEWVHPSQNHTILICKLIKINC